MIISPRKRKDQSKYMTGCLRIPLPIPEQEDEVEPLPMHAFHEGLRGRMGDEWGTNEARWLRRT